MKNKTGVIGIGYGRQLFAAGNLERERLAGCAQETREYHHVVFTTTRDDFQKQTVHDTFFIHPTNSRTRFHMLFDAYTITKKIISASDKNWILTTQDVFATGLVGYVLHRRTGVRWVAQEHADVFSSTHWRSESLQNFIWYFVGLWLLKRVSAVRVVATRIAKTVQDRGITAPITQLPVVINPEPFRYRGRSRALPTGTFVYVTVARLVPQKNLTLLLRSFYTAWKTDTRLRLRIIGTGPEKSRLEQIVHEQYQTQSQVPVSFEAWTEDVPRVLREADGYVLSSNYEGWGRVLLEAMAAALPTVTTDVGCVGEVFQDGRHGLVVPVGGEKKMVSSLLRLSQDAPLYSQFVSNLQEVDFENVPGTNPDEYSKKWVATLQ